MRLPSPNPDRNETGQMASIAALQRDMQSGVQSATGLTRHFLSEIERRNPELCAVIAVNPGAVEAAERLDAERAAGQVRGPLHGIPILIKDNIETYELPTTAGSSALRHNQTGRDAPLVARLREAGAVILGKSNLSQWANFRSSRSSSGWSSIGGQCRNAHDLTRSPGGSSSGSGVAVAAGLCVAAVGTETNGSIISPAAANGIVGHKPTVGLVSRTHIIPISHTQDTAGPMTRCVADAAILLSALAGPDAQDGVTQHVAAHQEIPYTLDGASLASKRLGVLRTAMGYHEGVDALFESALSRMQKAGAILCDISFEPYDAFGEETRDILLYEFKDGINRYLRALPNELQELTPDRLITFNRRQAETEMPYFQQEIFEQAQAKGALSEPSYQEALSRVRAATRAEGIDRTLREEQLDALIAPSKGAAWKIDLINGDHGLGGVSTLPAVAGYPHITLPMGKLHHMPIGISLIGAAFADQVLLKLAAAFEQLDGADG